MNFDWIFPVKTHITLTLINWILNYHHRNFPTPRVKWTGPLTLYYDELPLQHNINNLKCIRNSKYLVNSGQTKKTNDSLQLNIQICGSMRVFDFNEQYIYDIWPKTVNTESLIQQFDYMELDWRVYRLLKTSQGIQWIQVEAIEFRYHEGQEKFHAWKSFGQYHLSITTQAVRIFFLLLLLHLLYYCLSGTFDLGTAFVCWLLEEAEQR